MPFTVVTDLPGASGAQYDALMRALEGRGVGAPDGRLWHVASRSDDGWLMIDVWESVEQLARFAPVLASSCRATGIVVAAPRVYPVHRMLGAW